MDLKLGEFAGLENSLGSLAQHAFEPLGMPVLREIRQFISAEDLPILIHAQGGFLTLDDRCIPEMERLGARWLLKDRFDARTEETLIHREILRAGRSRSSRGDLE